MNDPVFAAFLKRQHDDAAALAAASDLVDVVPIGPPPYQRHIVRLSCRGLVRGKGAVEVAERFDVGIYFAADYLRRAQPAEVITWFWPVNVFHPNIMPPFLCPGRLKPGTSLVELIYQIFEIVTYQKVTMTERNALNRDACVWARRNIGRFPIDKRGLKRETGHIRVKDGVPGKNVTAMEGDAPREGFAPREETR